MQSGVFQFPYQFDARPIEDFDGVRRLRQSVCQILTGKMQAFVQTAAPLGAIGYVVDDPFKCYVGWLTTLTIEAAQFVEAEYKTLAHQETVFD